MQTEWSLLYSCLFHLGSHVTFTNHQIMYYVQYNNVYTNMSGDSDVVNTGVTKSLIFRSCLIFIYSCSVVLSDKFHFKSN